MSLASIYQSPSSQDPAGISGFNGGGNFWIQTDSGLVFIRNKANTAWNFIGSEDQASFGLMPLGGATLSGATTGFSGLMTADGNTPFAVPPTITSKSSAVATLADLYNVQTSLNTLVNEIVAQSIASITTPGIRSNIVILNSTDKSAGAYNANVTIPIANLFYANGTAVAASEAKAFASMGAITFSHWPAFDFLTIENTTNGMIWKCYEGNGYNLAGTFNYFLIAIKAGS